jgi:hypothetical protein
MVQRGAVVGVKIRKSSSIGRNVMSKLSYNKPVLRRLGLLRRLTRFSF